MPTWVYYFLTFVAGYLCCAAAFLAGELIGKYGHEEEEK